jgi:hypothetical protein
MNCTNMEFTRICCRNISYRSGFIEVLPNLHPGHINIEVWNIHPDFRQPAADIRDGSIPDKDITGNTEIELDIEQAKKLVELLNHAIGVAVKQAVDTNARS